jgi:hypothetical protein
MNASISLRTVLRRTFGIYAGNALVLLTASGLMSAIVALDRALSRRYTALDVVVFIVDLVVIALFVGAVVLLVADVWGGGPCRSARALLRGAWSALGRLLLVGVLAGVTIGFISSIATLIVFAIVAGALLTAGAGFVGLMIGVFTIPIMLVVPELFLLTIWSVVMVVAVLERPGGLRAFGRSRELVRGNGWRVLLLILVLAIPLAIAAGAIARAAGPTGSWAAAVVQLLAVTVIAPIPVLAATSLYFELRRVEPSAAPADLTLGPVGPVAPTSRRLQV